MNMKRAFLLIGIMLLAMLFAGCQEKSAEKAAALPLREAVEKALTDKDSLVAYTADDLTDLMGILPEDYTEALFLVGSDSLSGREIIAVRAKDASSLKKTADALQNYLSQRMEETRNYLPDAYKLQSQAKVESKNLTAVLIVGAHSAEETKAFLAGE
ncbi:MAG: DUF4358 domain-containing protein [Clostridia bacterium]|nr:DUF4358 domain-containing protein [Clostridia bacterium]